LSCHFVFTSRRRHTRLVSDWSSDVCSSDLAIESGAASSTAPNDVTIVPTMNGCHAAYVSLTGSQPLDQMKLSPQSWIDGQAPSRSEERRVGKEGRSRWSQDQ